MNELATTKMSTKGQVVIPEAVRNRLGLHAGAQFVVLGEDDVLIMKTISKPSMREFDSLIKKTRKQASSAGLKHADIEEAITAARSKE